MVLFFFLFLSDIFFMEVVGISFLALVSDRALSFGFMSRRALAVFAGVTLDGFVMSLLRLAALWCVFLYLSF